MLQHTETPSSRVAATYKAREVEGLLDLYFYRPIGLRLAEFFEQLKMTPDAVTFLGGIDISPIVLILFLLFIERLVIYYAFF